MKDFFGTEIKIDDIVAFATPWPSGKSFTLGKVLAIGKTLVEIQFEDPNYDGDIYPDKIYNKYDYIKKRPENVIVKTI